MKYILLLCFAAVSMAGCGASIRAESATQPATSPSTQSQDADAGPPYHAVAIQINRVDWFDMSPEYKKSQGHGGYREVIDEIVDLGADTVLMAVDCRMENGSSTTLYMDLRATPSAEALGSLIDYAKRKICKNGKKMRVMLMPIVLLSKPRATEWRATIRPSNWKDWWESYRSMIGYFAQIAQDHHVDVFVVGSELVTTESLVNDWNQTIDSIRQIYKGRLTYSSNWDHYPMVKFWDKLDFIGMNSYWTLGQNRDVTVKEVADNWRSIQEDLGKFAKENKKSILFLELGWCSLSNAADEPWDYTKENLPADPQLQEKLWIGFFEAWSMTDWLGGYAIWDWKPGPCGPADKGYGVKGKPAYVVIKSL